MDFHGPLVKLFIYSLVLGNLVLCSDGPVFINPNALPVAPAVIKESNYETQTVYGFLDFTTTIGNTVMVFSPQSSSAVAEPPKETKSIQENVIVTKPSAQIENEPVTIKPTKSQLSAEKKASESSKKSSQEEQPQSKQHATTAAPTTSKKEIKATPSSKVNVIEGISSVVNVAPPIISSEVQVVEAANSVKDNIITKVEVVSVAPSKAETPVFSSIVQVVSNDPVESEPALVIGNNIGEPEYDFLSRQPSEFVEETYKVINLKPSSKFHLKPRPSAEAKNRVAAPTKRGEAHPTGLVTKLGGTVIKDGATTVHETSVIGTYISGKYAQVLQSTSRIHNNNKGKISPSPTLRILKTAAPSLGKASKHHRHLDPTPAASVNEETSLPVEAMFNGQNSIKTSRKPTGPGAPFKLRYKNRAKESESEEEVNENKEPSSHYSYKKSQRSRSQSANTRAPKHTTSHRSKFGRSRKTTTPSVHSEETTTAPPSFGSGKRFHRRNKQARTGSYTSESTNPNNGYSRRSYKPKVQTSTVEQVTASTSLYKFKLNRTPGRWQYKTTPKPRVTIRKQTEDEEQQKNGSSGGATQSQDVSPIFNDVVTPLARQDDGDALEGSESIASIIDDESSTENKLDTAFPLETIKVEISTPPDFKDIYYEIATIKSPYTFQAGSVRNTRYITVTSTFEKVITPEPTIAPTTTASTEPLTENILATSSNYAKDNNFLDSSVATLPPVYLASDMETPPLETLTETFSTTQTMLKTHILPMIRSPNETSTSTLVQTYLVTRLVTATKTLPPMEAYHFIPSKILNEFNSHLDEAGSELHLELDFGDQLEQDENGHIKRVFPPDLDLTNIGSDFNLSEVDKMKLPNLRTKKMQPITSPKPSLSDPPPTPGFTPDQLQQLALLRLFNPAAAAQPQVITTSKPILKVETVYESHVIPIINGQNTILSTISKIVGTVTKTDFEYGTSTVAPALPAIPPIPPVPVNPLFPAAQPQFALTTTPVVQTTSVTETRSKVLKLTFGAKTAFTTIFSTTVVPTVLTTYMTASVPVAPTAAYPGFYPAPYPPFPYVG